jgi:DNA-binding MarR family transcriptional regulator
MPTDSPRKTRHRGFDSLEQEAFLNLWRTYDRLRALEEDLFGRHDLTPQQYNALRLLRGEYPEPMPTLALAGRLVSRSPDITRLLDKLESKGLIERDRPAENRRVVLVRITANGLTLLGSLDAPLRECHTRQLGHLSQDQLKSLVNLLRQARAAHESPGGPWDDESHS